MSTGQTHTVQAVLLQYYYTVLTVALCITTDDPRPVNYFVLFGYHWIICFMFSKIYLLRKNFLVVLIAWKLISNYWLHEKYMSSSCNLQRRTTPFGNFAGAFTHGEEHDERLAVSRWLKRMQRLSISCEKSTPITEGDRSIDGCICASNLLSLHLCKTATREWARHPARDVRRACTFDTTRFLS